MALSDSATKCRHRSDHPTSGRRKVGFIDDDDRILFRCERCGSQSEVPRCPEMSASTGERCRGAVLFSPPGVCRAHIPQAPMAVAS